MHSIGNVRPVIRSLAPRTVMVDTCVLSKVATEPKLREEFADWVVAGEIVCYVSVISLAEITADAKGDGGHKDIEVGERLMGLHDLAERIGGQLRSAAHFNDAVIAEVSQRQINPLETEESRKHLSLLTGFSKRKLASVLKEALKYSRHVERKKDIFHDLDSNAVRAEVERLVKSDPERYRDLALSSEPSNVVAAINRRGVDAHPICQLVATGLLDDAVTAAQLEEKLSNYPVLNCFEQLSWRAFLANGTPLNSKQKEIVLFRTKRNSKGRGDWYDHFIAAAAAPCSMFVTDDERLWKRCRHIQRSRSSGVNAYVLSSVLNR